MLEVNIQSVLTRYSNCAHKSIIIIRGTLYYCISTP